MKDTKNFMRSIKRNSGRLSYLLPIVALCGLASLLVWQTSAQMQGKENEEDPQVESINGDNSPTLGNYPTTFVVLGANTIVTPDAAPFAASINVSTNSNFKGTFVANTTTGVVRVTNAHPAGTYTVTVKAFILGMVVSKTFIMGVSNGTVCNGPVRFNNVPDVTPGGAPYSAAIGDFNNDGNQDLAVANAIGSTVSIRLGNGLGGFSGSTNVSVVAPDGPI
nr:VCBS repeat-containing protein [Blastocatellia bacterium]